MLLTEDMKDMLISYGILYSENVFRQKSTGRNENRSNSMNI